MLSIRPRGTVKTSLGGKGVDPRETVKLLESVTVTKPRGRSDCMPFRIFFSSFTQLLSFLFFFKFSIGHFYGLLSLNPFCIPILLLTFFHPILFFS